MALAGLAGAQAPTPCWTYSVYKGQGRKGALVDQGVQEAQEVPDAPHGRCQGVPEVQVGRAGPGCSLPWDPGGAQQNRKRESLRGQAASAKRPCREQLRAPPPLSLPPPSPHHRAWETWPPTSCTLLGWCSP